MAVSLLGAVCVAEAVIRSEVSDWDSLDSAFITLQQESEIAMQIYAGLVNWKYGTGEIEPDLAESWDVSEDGTVYTFYLRRGVQFHHGYGEVTAVDVKYSFDRILDPETAAPLAGHYSMISEIKVIDDYTVQLILSQPYSPLLQRLVPYKAAGIVPKAAVEKWGEDFGFHPVSAGPFEWVSGDPRGEIILLAFDNYYKGRSKIDKVVYTHIADDTVAYAAFEGGDLNMVNVADPDVLERYLADPNIEVGQTTGLNLNYIILNLTQEPFTDIRVRQALNYGIDKQAMFDTVLKGVGADLDGPVPRSCPFYEPDKTTYPYDPDKAKQLLAEAGYPNGFSTTLYAYIGGPAVPTCVAVQDQLKKIGVNAELKALEISAWQNVVLTGTTPMYFMRITRPPDPDEFLVPVMLSTSYPTWNTGRYVNAEVDDLIDQGRTVADPEKRAEIYSKLQKIVADDVPNIWLYSDIIATAYRPNMHGFKLDPLWNNVLYPMYFDEE
ncbi:MAG: ABC transporter substrate-binding protein [Methanothrix sp.]|nr:MAG: ABC transporter substrate-binding protein [Methanothrix sp.]